MKGVMVNTDFLDKNYQVPSGPSKYYKFEIGANKFRVLASPIIGWLGWKDKHPIRVKMDEKIRVDQVDDPAQVKHFWAMPVYDYKSKSIKILEITQKGIQRTIVSLTKDDDWGTPLLYDIVVTREGEGLDTEYQVIPSPPKPISKEITDAFTAIKIDLTALYRNEDPFGEDVTDTDFDKIAEILK